ncbi:N-acetylglucosamine-6-phosphate deacetylase [Vibrio sp. JC009]|uniref:N-acetylglucosamine-6-phosphate deacetylase n=1 Tax=Vibrio sp. JC009 TaxID=2912314 RepID=UPI0023B1FDAB|nr:N-acetylglucosamine-6-phosphate deacetylase [Vibrio sp. JC009]WED24946.1 N-acetylglucosamine-6-phosphate deacetylase [Vibrio sp. JC009]
MASDRQYIRAGQALIGTELRQNVVLVVGADGLIEAVLPESQCSQPCQDFRGCTLLPGMIDTHVHGAVGFDVMDASHEGLEAMSWFFAAKGVTAFVATTVTAPVNKIKQVLLQVGKSKRKGLSGAALLGAYLEGPYFTPRHKGAHPEHLFRELDTRELDSWISYSDGSLLVVALAPEKVNAEKAIHHLSNCGVRVTLGHTDATAEQVQAAFSAGADGLVHCYNGMSGLHHRGPGVVGAGLCQPDSYIEMIADGHHVHPLAIDVAHRCCGERLMLITDAMRAAGMPDGEYMLGEYQVEVSGGIARTKAGGLAGSTLTLIDAVKNLSAWLDMPFEQAWLSASLTPANFLGIADRYGSLEVGKKASMVAVTDSKQIQNTWVDGNMVYAADKTTLSEAVCI